MSGQRTRRDWTTGKVTRPKVAMDSPCGKQAYRSKKLAKASAAVESKQSGENIEAYKCPRGCHAWHIGHARRAVPVPFREAKEREVSARDRIIEGLERLRVAHRLVEDCWYSCPQSEEGCCNDAEGDECNCGADTHNARIDELIALVKETQ